MLICSFDLSLKVHGEQLRSCRDSQLLNHTFCVQASRRPFTSILVPILCKKFALLEPAEERKNSTKEFLDEPRREKTSFLHMGNFKKNEVKA